MLYVRDDIDKKNAHSKVQRPDVPVYVRRLFRAHFAIRTLESGPLAAVVTHVSVQIRLSGEAARTLRTVKRLGFLLRRTETPATWQIVPVDWNKNSTTLIQDWIRARNTHWTIDACNERAMMRAMKSDLEYIRRRPSRISCEWKTIKNVARHDKSETEERLETCRQCVIYSAEKRTRATKRSNDRRVIEKIHFNILSAV